MLVPSVVRRRVFEPIAAMLQAGGMSVEWKALEESQFLPASSLRARQEERLERLLATVNRTSPFYRERFRAAGVTPGDVRSLEDLSRIPVLTKRDVRAHRRDLMVSGTDPETLLEFRTGGSTGMPLVLFATEKVSHQRNACARRCNRWTGWEVGEPVGAVWGNPHLPSTLKERLWHELLEPVIYLDTMALTGATIEAFARAWKGVRPTLLFGHAHSIYVLARGVREQGIDSITPKGIVSTSMMLLPHERVVIEQVFGVRVFDRYGCEEVGLIACECERHDGLHLNMDHLVVEFLRDDGTAARPGEVGNLVITDLLNEAMPLIRYKIEDLAAPVPTPCSCGRGLLRMSRLAGRVSDFLRRMDGARIAGVSLIENSLTKFPGIEQMQIVQDSIADIRLRIVPEPGFGSRAGSDVADYFSGVFPGASIRCETVSAIEREANGKFRFAICNVPD